MKKKNLADLVRLWEARADHYAKEAASGKYSEDFSRTYAAWSAVYRTVSSELRESLEIGK